MNNILKIFAAVGIAIIFISVQQTCNEKKGKTKEELSQEISKLQQDKSSLTEVNRRLKLELSYKKAVHDTFTKVYYSSRDIVRNTKTTDTVYRDICLSALNDCDSALISAESIISTQDSIITESNNIDSLNSVIISNQNRELSELKSDNAKMDKKLSRKNTVIETLVGISVVLTGIMLIK